MKKIHVIASLPHYREHVRAVWKHLPEGLKGRWLSGRAIKEVPDDDYVMVAGFQDIDRAEGRKVVYVEHGAGQSYVGLSKGHGHYHGSDHPENVVAYLAPRQDVADSWGRPAIAVGSPVCDPYPLFTDPPKTVAITFHWDCKLLPETRSALDHYVHDLGRIVRSFAAQGYSVLGHHHPRDTRLPLIWRKLQVTTADVDTVRQYADLLIADNTSLAYEMAYLQRRVITLNAPWYRRDVEHGLRFWSHVPGLLVDSADELLAASDFAAHAALHDWMIYRHPEVCKYVYGKWCSDGSDGVRAAAGLTALLAGM